MGRFVVHLVCLLIFIFIWSGVFCDVTDNEIGECHLPQELKNEIAGYRSTVDLIMKNVLNGTYKGTTYKQLAEFVDRFGYRISGSDNLENAIDYMLRLSEKNGLENVHGEDVMVPHWVRGEESAAMLEPRVQKLRILGLGSTVGTPAEGIRAEIVVVRDFNTLDELGSQVRDKIVVYNQIFTTYGESVVYRSHGADRAAKYGAVAALVRSVTPFSLNTPHTGWQDYSGNVTKIPVACITVEDAEMLQRRHDKGEKVVIELKMGAKDLPEKKSRNTVVEITGSAHPEKSVIVSGHLDSWDVGEGAMDDGAGAILGWNSLVILNNLGLRPKRTLRAVLWTGEEEGLVGAFAYAKQHKSEIDNITFVMESDEGTFTPQGLEYAGPKYGACILREILGLFKSINATDLLQSDAVGSDIMVLIPSGIPGASLKNANERYFWYHHTAADTMAVEDPMVLDQCTAFWAAVSYIIADLSVDMPRPNGTKN